MRAVEKTAEKPPAAPAGYYLYRNTRFFVPHLCCKSNYRPGSFLAVGPYARGNHLPVLKINFPTFSGTFYRCVSTVASTLPSKRKYLYMYMGEWGYVVHAGSIYLQLIILLISNYNWKCIIKRKVCNKKWALVYRVVVLISAYTAENSIARDYEKNLFVEEKVHHGCCRLLECAPQRRRGRKVKLIVSRGYYGNLCRFPRPNTSLLLLLYRG